MKRARVLFVQPSLQPPGGSNGVAACMLEALASRFDVTVFSLAPLRPAETDAYYGTAIEQYRINNVVCDFGVLALLKKLPFPTGLVELHLFMRHAKRAAAGPYDLICSAFNEQDFARPCIEYIHYPWNHPQRPDVPPGWNESRPFQQFLRFYYWLCRQVSGFRMLNRPANLTLVNSTWTGLLTQKMYPGTPYIVLHPPALCACLENDRSIRQPKFLAIGRVSPSKEWLKLIDIAEGLRVRGHAVALTLAGSRYCEIYEALVRQRIQEVGPWVELRLDFSRAELEELMRTHDYGLHGMRDEHYGMGVAELVLGGCLTMVPNDGGQIEIVTDPRLHYASTTEAIEKWHAILSEPALQLELLDGQRARRPHLGKERFLQEFHALLDRCLEVGVERAGL